MSTKEEAEIMRALYTYIFLTIDAQASRLAKSLIETGVPGGAVKAATVIALGTLYESVIATLPPDLGVAARDRVRLNAASETTTRTVNVPDGEGGKVIPFRRPADPDHAE